MSLGRRCAAAPIFAVAPATVRREFLPKRQPNGVGRATTLITQWGGPSLRPLPSPNRRNDSEGGDSRRPPLELGPERPEFRKGALGEGGLEVGDARRAAGAAFEPDDPLHGDDMFVAPGGERIVHVDELFGELVERPPARRVAVDL